MRSGRLALVVLAFLAPIVRGQEIIIRVGGAAPLATVGAQAPPGTMALAITPDGGITVTRENITITVTVNGKPVPVAPDPPDPPDPPGPDESGSGDGATTATGAEFAGSVRMYLRGMPVGWRRVAGQIGTNIKTMDQLTSAIESERKRAANGMTRRFATRWEGCFDPTGNIVNPDLIRNSLIEAAVAAEAGLR